jgi:phosphoribosyl-ATP pyrophosphohydrolase/phosphoribosyl-AMP cyclohydrolase
MMELQEIAWDERGLVPVVAQDAASGRVLMLAYANREAVLKTLETGLAHFWSRSRQRLWRKGETSGHVLHVDEVRLDCDGDALLYRVRPQGPACHTGEESCFFRQLGGEASPTPPAPRTTIERLAAVIAQRQAEPRPGSYTCTLLAGAPALPARKVGEEAVETVVAALAQDDQRLIEEAADLVYHLLVLVASRGLTWQDVERELERRAS